MEFDKLRAIIKDMRIYPEKYDQNKRDIVLRGLEQEAQRLSENTQSEMRKVEPGLSPEESIQALRQYRASKYRNEWDKQKEWDAQRQRFRKAFRDMETLGVPKEKLQPYILQFLEKEAEMNNRSILIPEEQLPFKISEPWT